MLQEYSNDNHVQLSVLVNNSMHNLALMVE